MFELYLGLDEFGELLYFGSYPARELAIKWSNKFKRLKSKIIEIN